MAGSLLARARFMAALVFRVARRAVPTPAKSDYDSEDLIEAIMTGDVELLDSYGIGLSYARHTTGTPWFFIALECGSLSAINWFLSHGADPCAPDQSGRLPLETIVQRASLADEMDEHLPDCAAMARALISHGAKLSARTIQGETLSERAAALGLTLL